MSTGSSAAGSFPLVLGTPAQFASVRRALLQAGYSEAAIGERLGIAELSEFRSLRQGRTAGVEMAAPLDLLIRLFLDGEYVAASVARELLSDALLADLRGLGLIAAHAADPERLYGTVFLYPARSLYLASDRATDPDFGSTSLPVDVVYPAVVENTRHFLDLLPNSPCDAFLDLGAGTGIAALLAAGYARHSWATDITARAAHYAEFNRLLNGISNATVTCGDLYQPVEGLSFDRIVAHPPYVPALRASYIFRDGGEDGEQIARRIVAGLPRFLRPGGRLYMQTLGSDREGETFEQRIRQWLGESASQFDVLLIARTTNTPADFATQSLLKSLSTPEEHQQWAKLFEKLQVRYLVYGAVIIQRHSAERPAFTLRTHMGPRSGPRESDWLLAWQIAAADTGMAARLLGARPAASPHLGLAVLYRMREGALAPEAFNLETEYPFAVECRCQPWVARLISSCDGKTTAREHFERLLGEGAIPAQTSLEEFAEVLAALLTGGFLVLDSFPLPSPDGAGEQRLNS